MKKKGGVRPGISDKEFQRELNINEAYTQRSPMIKKERKLMEHPEYET